MLPTAVPTDPGLVEACSEDPSWACETVWDLTGSEALAKAADWLVGAPLTALVILLVAFVVNRIARRAVGRVVERTIAPERFATAGLQKVGLKTPELLGVREPRLAERTRTITQVLRGVISVTVWTVAFLLALGEFGISLAPLLAGAGVAGVALGFGAQSLVKDCISGLFMLLEDQYGVGDVVDLGEAVGTVEKVSLRVTTLRAADGTVWHVPNGEILRVGNKSQLWSMALLDVTVAPDADLDRARQAILATAAAVCERPEHRDQVLEAPRILGVERLGPEGVTWRLTVKTQPGEQWALLRVLREQIKRQLDDAGVPLPQAPRPPWLRGEAEPGSGGPPTP